MTLCRTIGLTGDCAYRAGVVPYRRRNAWMKLAASAKPSWVAVCSTEALVSGTTCAGSDRGCAPRPAWSPRTPPSSSTPRTSHAVPGSRRRRAAKSWHCSSHSAVGFRAVRRQSAHRHRSVHNGLVAGSGEPGSKTEHLFVVVRTGRCGMSEVRGQDRDGASWPTGRLLSVAARVVEKRSRTSWRATASPTGHDHPAPPRPCRAGSPTRP